MGYHQSQQSPVTMNSAFSVDKLQFYLCLARASSSLPTQNHCIIYHYRANTFLCMSVAYKQLLPQPGHSSILLRKESSASNNLGCRFFSSNKIIFFCFSRSDTWGCSGHKTPETVYFGKQGHPRWEVLLATTKSGVLNQTAPGQRAASLILTDTMTSREGIQELTDAQATGIFGILTCELKCIKACGRSSDERSKYFVLTAVSVYSGK